MKISDLIARYEEKNEIKSYEKLIEEVSYLSREIIIGDIEDDSGIDVTMFIRFCNKIDNERNIPLEEREPIKLIIDSNGGSLSSCFTIIDAISTSITPVYTIVIGCAYSAGLFIAISGHKRFCYSKSSFLFHEGGLTSGGYMDANKFKNFADFYKRTLKELKTIMLQYTAINEEWYKENQNEDIWLNAQEAKNLGMVDEILTVYK